MTMTNTLHTPVLVVGAGPVGLTLAMDLAWRGIEVLVLEKRARGVPPPVKSNHTSARSMEIFRRLGVADELRNNGLPGDFPHSVSYRVTAIGKELTRIKIPSRNDRFTATDGPDCGWPTPEPPHRINQIYLEPILFAHAESFPTLKILSETELSGFENHDDEVIATAYDHCSGKQLTIHCQYLVGCDGGSSTVRKGIGAKFEGDAVIQRAQSTYIRAPQLLAMMQAGPAWASFSLNPQRSGNMYAIDGKEKWLIHNYLRDDEPDFDSVDRDACIRAILGVGPDFEYEVLGKEDWYGRRLIANKFRQNRVFVCGDAAHIWVPYAGYGMNAGIADATNLSWLLAAHLNGWAPASILDAYTCERQPITEQVSHFVMNHCMEMAKQRMSVPDNIDADDEAGAAARAELGRQAYELNVQQYAAAGLNFGYYYDASPLIAYDGEKQPGYTMSTFTSSTVPGCRVPHLWLADGRSLYDALGPEYTLLRFDPELDVQPLLNAAAKYGVPLTLLDVKSQEAAEYYPEKLVLARPDQHIAWRGNQLPDDADQLIQRIRGALSE